MQTISFPDSSSILIFSFDLKTPAKILRDLLLTSHFINNLFFIVQEINF